MHIPDGILDTKTILVTSALSAAGLSHAFYRLRKSVTPRKITRMGLSAAFIFAAQMVNFPVLAGTSGHLVGAALATCLLGPSEALVSLTAVLIVQSLVFADGGITVLGANIFNMAIVATYCSYWTSRGIVKVLSGHSGTVAAAMAGGWTSIVLASAICSGELAWSGVASWELLFTTMVNIHFVIGLGEAILSGLILASILKSRPSVVSSMVDTDQQTWHHRLVAASLLGTAILLFVVPFASPLPDGLEATLKQFGVPGAGDHVSSGFAPLANYRIPGISSPALSTIAAGGIGAVLILISSVVMGRTSFPKDSDS